MEEKKVVKMVDLLADSLEDEFMQFDLTHIQSALSNLRDVNPIDIAHAELLQQEALSAADMLVEYIGKIIKTVSYLETKHSSVKNKIALEYKNQDGTKVTLDQRKYAGESSQEAEDWGIKIAKAKGSKAILEKKYDILIKLHHYYKDISLSLRRGIPSKQTGAERAEKELETTWGAE